MSGGHSDDGHKPKEGDTLAREVLEEIASEVGGSPKGDMSLAEGMQRYDVLARPDSTAQKKLARKAAETFGRDSKAFKTARTELEKMYGSKSSKVVLKDLEAVNRVIDVYMDNALGAAYMGLDQELKKEIKAMEQTKGGKLTKQEILELKMGIFDSLMGSGGYQGFKSIRNLKDELFNSRREEALAALEQASAAYGQQLATHVFRTLGNKYVSDNIGTRSKLAGIIREELGKSQYEASTPLISRSTGELLSLHSSLKYGSIAPDKLDQYGLRGKKDVEADTTRSHGTGAHH